MRACARGMEHTNERELAGMNTRRGFARTIFDFLLELLGCFCCCSCSCCCCCCCCNICLDGGSTRVGRDRCSCGGWCCRGGRRCHGCCTFVVRCYALLPRNNTTVLSIDGKVSTFIYFNKFYGRRRDESKTTSFVCLFGCVRRLFVSLLTRCCGVKTFFDRKRECYPIRFTVQY